MEQVPQAALVEGHAIGQLDGDGDGFQEEHNAGGVRVLDLRDQGFDSVDFVENRDVAYLIRAVVVAAHRRVEHEQRGLARVELLGIGGQCVKRCDVVGRLA